MENFNGHRIKIAQPWVTQLEIDYVEDAIKNGWGDNMYFYIEKLEKLFSSIHNLNYATSTSSCTGATHLALEAMGIGEGDEVILPEITWASCPGAVIYSGAKPVFVDVIEETWCIDPKKIEDAITSKTKAIMPVHVYGNICEMDEIMNIAKKHNLKVIEDAAEALGSKYKGKRVGSIGDCGVFSFHGTKTASSGAGGMFITDDEDLYEEFTILHNQGRVKEEKKFFYPHKIGLKYKFSNLQAAMACAQIERLDELVNKKKQIFNWYQESFKDIQFISMNHQQEYAENSYWMTTLVFDKSLDIDRDNLMSYLNDKGVDSRPFFYPLSSLPMFKPEHANKISYNLYNRGIYLPGAFHLSKKDIDYVSKCLIGYLKETKIL